LGVNLVIIIANLTPSLSFGHNSQFKVPNGKFKLNFNIGILRNFQWYKQLSVWTKFTHCTFVPKDWNTLKLPTPKLESILQVPKCVSFSFPQGV